jgi:hypothetical protein
MKTLKFLNSCLLGLAAMLLVIAVFAFINGNIIYGICNILWMGCEIIFFSVNKKSIETEQKKEKVNAFLSYMNDIIEKHGAAVITEDKEGYWQMSCASENNDNIESVHNEKGETK